MCLYSVVRLLYNFFIFTAWYSRDVYIIEDLKSWKNFNYFILLFKKIILNLHVVKFIPFDAHLVWFIFSIDVQWYLNR